MFTDKETAESNDVERRKKKPVFLTLQDRVLVIDMHNQGMSVSKIAEELGCSRTQVQVTTIFSSNKNMIG